MKPPRRRGAERRKIKDKKDFDICLKFSAPLRLGGGN